MPTVLVFCFLSFSLVEQASAQPTNTSKDCRAEVARLSAEVRRLRAELARLKGTSASPELTEAIKRLRAVKSILDGGSLAEIRRAYVDAKVAVDALPIEDSTAGARDAARALADFWSFQSELQSSNSVFMLAGDSWDEKYKLSSKLPFSPGPDGRLRYPMQGVAAYLAKEAVRRIDALPGRLGEE